MYTNNRQQVPQPELPPPFAAAAGDWRCQVTKNRRKWIIDKIISTCLPYYGHEYLKMLLNIAMGIEADCLTAATHEGDYLWKITWSLHIIESSLKANQNALLFNSAGMDRNLQVQNVQSQAQSQHQSLPTPVALIQGQLPSTHSQSMQEIQQPEVQILQSIPHYSGMNPQLQFRNVQVSSVPQLQLRKEQKLNSVASSSSGITSAQQKMMYSLQPGSNLCLGQGSTPTSILQNSTSRQARIYSAPQIGMNLENSKRPASDIMLHGQYKKQQNKQQIMQQRQHIQEPSQQTVNHLHLQQTLPKQQQQSYMQQGKQQKLGQLQWQQMPQLEQMNDVNALKMRQHMDHKPQSFAQNHLQGKEYPQQELNHGLLPSNSSLQCTRASSSQINQHSSPFVAPSSAPLAPSPIHGDPMVSSLSSTAIAIDQQATPLLEDLSPLDSHGNTLNSHSGKSMAAQQLLQPLIRAVKSVSSKTLNAFVSDIGSNVSMIDQIGGSVPGDGFTAAVAEDLAAVENYQLQDRNWIEQDGSTRMKRKRDYTNISFDGASYVGGRTDSLTGLDEEFVATSCAKRPRTKINLALLEEIRKINERLIDTVVDVCDEDFASEEGTYVKCSYNAVSLSTSLKSHCASEKMLPIQPLRLLVPVNYPSCSPILLNKFSDTERKEYNDLSWEAYSRFSIRLRTMSQPMSVSEIARTWDDSARSAISDYATLLGGGTFTSKFGTFEDCLVVV